jgi:hypothetical protein
MIAFAAVMRMKNSVLRIQDSGSGGFSVKPRWDLGSLNLVSP